jgi:predicted DNA-binding protein (MmcQ/YjbR family)
MAKEEMMNRIEELKFKRMCLACKDHWDREDYKTDDKMFAEILELREAIKNL